MTHWCLCQTILHRNTSTVFRNLCFPSHRSPSLRKVSVSLLVQWWADRPRSHSQRNLEEISCIHFSVRMSWSPSSLPCGSWSTSLIRNLAHLRRSVYSSTAPLMMMHYGRNELEMDVHKFMLLPDGQDCRLIQWNLLLCAKLAFACGTLTRICCF